MKNLNFDSRHIKWLWQRLTRGFDNRELWNLDDTIVNFILPRLKEFKKINSEYPGCLTEQEWNEILDKIINSFQLLKKNEWINEKEDEKINEGLLLFIKHLRDLWY